VRLEEVIAMIELREFPSDDARSIARALYNIVEELKSTNEALRRIELSLDTIAAEKD
jgi:hypothetical protein